MRTPSPSLPNKFVGVSRFPIVRLLRVVVGASLLIGGIAIGTVTCLPPVWSFALSITGGLVLMHLSIEMSLLAVRRRAPVTEPDEIDPFLLDTIRQIVNWLITGSGVIIGLLVKSTLDSLGVASALCLVMCIVLGFIHISIFSGGVHSDAANSKTTINAINLLYANIVLNVMFIFFLMGIVGLTVGVMHSSK